MTEIHQAAVDDAPHVLLARRTSQVSRRGGPISFAARSCQEEERHETLMKNESHWNTGPGSGETHQEYRLVRPVGEAVGQDDANSPFPMISAARMDACAGLRGAETSPPSVPLRER